MELQICNLGKRPPPPQVFHKLAAQIMPHVAVGLVAAPVPEKILRACVIVHALLVLSFDFGLVRNAPGKPTVFILMIGVFVLTKNLLANHGHPSL